MAKVLIIEDDVNINNMMAEALGKQGLLCRQAFSGTEGLLCLRMEAFELVLLDLMLPGMKGEDVLVKIQEQNPTPVIVISAKDELDTKVELLSLGAEDYMTKPFEIKELIARVMVQLRRSHRFTEDNVVSFKELKLYREAFRASVNDVDLALTKQEYKILELLMTYPNKVFSKQEIYEYAWDEFYIGVDKTINVHISNMRSKLKVHTDQNYIETVWGIGFKLAK